MDGHDRDHRLLTGFLAGDLDPAAARRWDEHLLECERCWQAVREDRAGRDAARLLRRPAPGGLADRVAFAVEMAAADRPAARRQARPARRPAWWRLAGAATLAATLAVTLLVLLPGGHRPGSIPAAVTAVAHYARAVPAPARARHTQPGGGATPVPVGRPATVTARGQRIVMRTWRLDGTEAVVAVSSQPFPMPPGAASVPGPGMAWSTRLGRLGLYCLNGRRSELLAAPVPTAQLAALAARLPPG
jgi:anti-sigma factor RsiW